MNYNEFVEYTIDDFMGKVILVISNDSKLINNIINKSSTINKTFGIDLEKTIRILPENNKKISLRPGHWLPFDNTPITYTLIYHVDTIRKVNESNFSTSDFVLICQLEATSFMLGYVRNKFQTADSFESIVELYLANRNIMVIDNDKYKIGYMNIEKMETFQHLEVTEITI